ncbi:MAG TPA: GNAT family N-acetyltransferase [Gammaproteobacteria bacterium]|nr:GNAT family N-acetyltransferase [Gammaproteobacteria bacterium]
MTTKKIHNLFNEIKQEIPDIKGHKAGKIIKSSNLNLVLTNAIESPPFLYLQQFYEFEFSPITLYDTNEMGFYDHQKLRLTWHQHYHAYLFYLSHLPIGFAVINLASQINYDQNTRDVAEFFVMPNYRNRGVGESMAFKLLDQYPGNWEIRQLFNATKARQFWLKVINNYTSGNFSEESEDHRWHGYLQKFTTNSKTIIQDDVIGNHENANNSHQ